MREDTMKMLNLYSDIEKKSVEDFKDELLQEALQNYKIMREGGVIATIPNPQISVIDEVRAKEAIATLEATAEKLLELTAGIEIPLFALVDFLEQRIFNDSEEERAKFRENLVFDSTQGGNANS